MRVPRFVQYFINMFNALPGFIQIVLTLILVGVFLQTYINMIKTGYRNDVRGSVFLPIIAISFASSYNPLIYITIWVAFYYSFVYKTGRYHIIIERITMISSFLIIPLITRRVYDMLDKVGVVDLIVHFFELV